MRLTWLGGAVYGGLYVVQLGCGVGHSCTLIGCESGASGPLDVPLSPAALDGKRLEVCRNDECVTSRITLRDGSPGSPQIACSPVTNETKPVAGCASTFESLDGGSGTRVQVTYTPWRESLANGDRYSIRITDASISTTIVQRTSTIATYTPLYPNGKECDGDHPCLVGTF